MAAIRPEVLAFIRTAQALLVRAAVNQPLTIEEACKITGCLENVTATLQLDKSHHNSQ
jgi:hypothetical protein